MRLQTNPKQKTIKMSKKTKRQAKNIVESLPYKIKDIKLAKYINSPETEFYKKRKYDF